ncbi:MAG: glycoside hydrolase family 97 protein [Bacteroidales bacterium]|nr:glycoside hydrolase family 97 protein [Bacteroidales bacterium]
MKPRFVLCFVAPMLFAGAISLNAASYKLLSPDGKVEIRTEVGKTITNSVYVDGNLVLAPSELSLTLADGTVWGKGSKVQKKKASGVDQTVPARIYKKSKVRNHYNQLVLGFKGFNLELRAYDEGAAWRFVSTSSKEITVRSEKAEFNFPDDYRAWIPYVKPDKENESGREVQFRNSFENIYTKAKISEWEKGHMAFLPILVDAGCAKLCITESDLLNYPGMYLEGEGGKSLKGVFAEYPDKVEQGGHSNIMLLRKSRKDYIAKLPAKASMPWRLVGIARNDADLLASDLVYNTATPAADVDWSWVKPGLVAWDWWNDWNLFGVDFVAGINDRTYEYYIDFAAKFGIPYVILDEGWSVHLASDLFQVVPEINLPHLAKYAADRGVGLVLWAGYYAFDRDMENVCRHYAQMGIKGFKVDFMNYDDQAMVDFYRRAAETTAKYHLFLDFHGAFKPAGLTRTYPNVLNFEGVSGLEQMKWKEDLCQPEYDVTIPYIRMFAGPMDYTQGAMLNGGRKDYRPVYDQPMSQGSRCHQLAEYVVFDAPFGMLCDSPSLYLQNEECTALMAAMPTVWDEVVPLSGKVGESVAVAKRSGEVWYVGATTNWDARDIEISLGFLPEGSWNATIFKDGVNAEKVHADYAVEKLAVKSSDTLSAHLVSGGGWVAKLTR